MGSNKARVSRKSIYQEIMYHFQSVSDVERLAVSQDDFVLFNMIWFRHPKTSFLPPKVSEIVRCCCQTLCLCIRLWVSPSSTTSPGINNIWNSAVHHNTYE
jgi:hypothetical protein